MNVCAMRGFIFFHLASSSSFFFSFSMEKFYGVVTATTQKTKSNMYISNRKIENDNEICHVQCAIVHTHTHSESAQHIDVMHKQCQCTTISNRVTATCIRFDLRGNDVVHHRTYKAESNSIQAIAKHFSRPQIRFAVFALFQIKVLIVMANEFRVDFFFVVRARMWFSIVICAHQHQ